MFAAATAAALFGSFSAHAAELDAISPGDRTTFNTRIYLSDPSQTPVYACFTRSYDPSHLAQHPHQTVRALKLLVKSDWSDEDRKVSHGFRLGVTYRKKSTAFESAGECRHARLEARDGEVSLSCGVDCDGGGIAIALGKTDDGVRVSLERVRIWPAGRDREDDRSGDLVAGEDDGQFRLERAPLEDCASLADDKAELAAMRKQPTFTRIGSR